MGTDRHRARHPWVYVALTAAFAGLAGSMLWAYPRWRWLGELPSRAEILAETVSGRFPGLGSGGASVPGARVIGAGGIPQPAMANVEKIFRRETDWLLACLTETGTFALAPGSDRIIPYFGNQAAVALLPEHPDKVKGHLEWYLSHLNRPDRWRLPGTVYDYTITAQGEMPTGSYDSADAYAATFLTAVARYWQATGDTQFVTAHRDDLDLVAGVLVTLQDSDGLMWARPGHWVKYLMDNSENFQGLQDYAWLLGQLGDRRAATYWGERAKAVRLGIKQVMYRPGQGEYCWAVKLSGTRRLPNWRQWYPDAASQLFPVLCGVERPDSRAARAVYRHFTSFYPSWASAPDPRHVPWGFLPPVALAMDDQQRLALALETADGLPARASVWHPGEAAWVLGTARAWLAGAAQQQAGSALTDAAGQQAGRLQAVAER